MEINKYIQAHLYVEWVILGTKLSIHGVYIRESGVRDISAYAIGPFKSPGKNDKYIPHDVSSLQQL